MTPKRTIFRIIVRIGVGLLTLVVCAAATVPIQQRIFRYRAEHLLTDIQAIELHKTSWSQAQNLMRRWGEWSHYDGACTAENCRYAITLADTGSGAIRPDDYGWTQKAVRVVVGSPVYRWLGGRPGTFFAGFIVQDGTIWRTYLHLNVEVPPRTWSRDDDWGYELIVAAQSRSSLNRDSSPRGSHWILGGDDQLATHPYYKAGRPGGCEICMSTEVTYSSATPQSEIRSLTAFDLSCLTRWRPCQRVEEILPAARPWHLYQLDGDPPEPSPALPKPCDIPVWALGRDAASILAVNVLSMSEVKNQYDGSLYEKAEVRLTEILKGKTPWNAGTILVAYPYSGERINPPLNPPEVLVPGRRYLALVLYSFNPNRWDNDPTPPGTIDGVPGISLERCGVVDDTPQNRLELQRGISQNDQLRVPDF
jgi:hypothetical protein